MIAYRYDHNAVRKLCDQFQLSQYKFAEMVGISRQHANLLYHGHNNPNVSTLSKIMTAFYDKGVRLNQFFIVENNDEVHHW